MTDIICSMIRRRIYLTGAGLLIAQYHKDHDSVDEDFHEYIAEKLVEQRDNYYSYLVTIIAATEAKIPTPLFR
jgi:hypothetical protein